MGGVTKITLLLAFAFSPFRYPFGSPFAHQNAQKIPFWLTLGALGSEFSTSVASTFQQCFFKACLESIFAKRIQKGRGPVSEGMTP